MNKTEILYESTTYSAGPGLDIKDFKVIEDWDNRPASKWSLSRIGKLQTKIENYTYKIYHSNRYGKLNLHKIIPGYKLIEFMNECFGYEGWRMEVLDVEATECGTVLNKNAESDHDINHNVVAEARVKVTLKDGTNIQNGGIGRGMLPTKGESFSKAKKEAVNNALKQTILGFEKMIIEYNDKVAKNYYVDGLYVAKIKTEASATINVKLEDHI
ncbi:hypothetical protein KAFR_0G03210 [Kazachstania africana CBS 2517]|uniref:DNA repair protein RAD59 n=1 Tax=Kazachstania africana (strain ATCC 22294 / BCRC 22015 / CBS 2517 / CECT 1963 / NBRC 1671 / NRRL Y-8276) TaxID=1071382 RepID=H2AYA3_KAZAF|nr:hypothetical protein KAFR_0G03210 [Kazachstania africana CBS 2517]CCF59353.1 hypothetical protein KAFR_0G03210 [Kazachstania africana CBS 2517]